MNPLKVILAVAVAIVVFHLGRWGWQEWQLQRPGFHETDCWFSKDVTGDATCGYLVVRENRQRTDSRTIRLPVVIFAAEPIRHGGPGSTKEAILYLTGGPGGSAYLGEQQHVDSWWLERRTFPKGRDLIVMGQRGTGLTEPDFDCHEFKTPEIALEAHARGTEPPDWRTLAVAAAVACAERLQAEGVDLAAYNSRESAADIAELRAALGIEAWSLYGVSYGTRLALSVLRYHPEGVSAVILDSPYPPEATHLIDSAAFYKAALHRYLTNCLSRSPCNVPPYGLWDQYLRAHEQVRRQPVELALSATGAETDLVITIDHRRLDELLFAALYNRETRPLIAPVLRALALASTGTERSANALRGEAELGNLLKGAVDGWSKGSKAVRLSHICRDEAPFDKAEALAAAAAEAGPLAHLVTEDFNGLVCPVWPSGSADALENTPVKSDVPALLLAGIYDPITPPELARAARAHLSNGHLFEFMGAGHGVIYEVDCAGSLIAEFLDDPQRRPEGECYRHQLLWVH